MVHRKDDGVTTYNYLVYDLLEFGGRPHSFFGMTIMLDNNQYCDDFKEVFDWFDYVFSKIKNEKNLFKRDDSGNIIEPLRYAITKFSDAKQDVEWIKSVLPKIFSTSSPNGVTLKKYDDSFISSKSGQIVAVNTEEDGAAILQAFKHYEWLSISPTNQLFIPGGEISDAVFELDYGDLMSKFNDFNARLLQIAVAPEKEGSSEVLLSLNKQVSASIDDISKYLSQLPDKDGNEHFLKLLQSYKDLQVNINTLEKKVSHEKVPTDSYRTCRRCGKIKSATYFKRSEDVCDVCLKKVHINKQRLIVGAIVAVAIITVIIISRLKAATAVSDIDDGEVKEVAINAPCTENKVDRVAFNKCLSQNDLEGAYECLKDKVDKEDYYSEMILAIDTLLWSLIDDESMSSNDIERLIADKWVKIYKICAYVEYAQDLSYWSSLVIGYSRLMELANKIYLTQEEKDEGLQLIKNEMRFSDFTDKIENKPLLQEDDKIRILVYERYVTPSMADTAKQKQDMIEVDNGQIITIEVKVKEMVHIHYRNGEDISVQDYKDSASMTRPAKTDGSGNYLRIQFLKPGKYEVKCNKTKIEIEVVAKFSRQ